MSDIVEMCKMLSLHTNITLYIHHIRLKYNKTVWQRNTGFSTGLKIFFINYEIMKNMNTIPPMRPLGNLSDFGPVRISVICKGNISHAWCHLISLCMPARKALLFICDTVCLGLHLTVPISVCFRGVPVHSPTQLVHTAGSKDCWGEIEILGEDCISARGRYVRCCLVCDQTESWGDWM